jgi:glucan biosynthesis protein
MSIPRIEKFPFNGKTFEVHVLEQGDQFTVYVTLDGEKVSPEYGVSIETHQDFLMQYKDGLVQHLVSIVKSDIENGFYFQS